MRVAHDARLRPGGPIRLACHGLLRVLQKASEGRIVVIGLTRKRRAGPNGQDVADGLSSVASDGGELGIALLELDLLLQRHVLEA